MREVACRQKVFDYEDRSRDTPAARMVLVAMTVVLCFLDRRRRMEKDRFVLHYTVQGYESLARLVYDSHSNHSEY